MIPILTRDLSDGFFEKLKGVASRIGARPQDLLAVMYSESDIKSNAHNPAGSMGINQMMTYADMDTPLSEAGPGSDYRKKQGFVLYNVGWRGTPRQYLALTAEQQLPYVERYFAQYASKGLGDIARLYTVNYLPAYLGPNFSQSTVLARKGEANYDQNAGLDVNKDGKVTPDDLEQWVLKRCDAMRFREALARLTGDQSVLNANTSLTAALNIPVGALAKAGLSVLGFTTLAGLGLGAFWLTRKHFGR